MKLSFLLLSILFLISFSGTAQADHHLVFINQVVKLSSSSCAVELEIEANNQNGFEMVDRVEVDGTLLVSLGTAANTIDSGGHVNTGDNILFASNSFMMQEGISADQSFADSQCGLFVANATFNFVIDDPAFGGPNAIIDSLLTSSNFGGDNTAMTKSSAPASPQFVDLTASNLQVANNAGSTVTVGSGNNNGGCSLQGEAASFSLGSSYLVFPGLALAVGTLLRRVRS